MFPAAKINMNTIKIRRQKGMVKIVDACYASDEPTYISPASNATTISSLSLSSHVSSNEDGSLSERDISPDVTNNIPNVVFTPNAINNSYEKGSAEGRNE